MSNPFDASHIANPSILSMRPYQAGKPIEELQRELGLEHVVKLASNENPLGPSPKVLEAMAKAAAETHLYPDSNAYELKKRLAAYLSSESTSIDIDQLTIGCGSNDVLDIIARVFLQPGKSAVYSQHAFVVYPLAVKATGARAIVTPAKDWGHDLQAMAQAIEADTSLVFIANPNNPTGTYIDRKEIVSFLDQVPSHVIVVLDEAYIEYVDSEVSTDPVDGIELLSQYPNLIVTRTFSKAYGLAALRIGYSISSPEICDLLNRVRAPFNVNSLALSGAIAALDDQDYIERSRVVNRSGMAQLTKGLDELQLSYITSAGNFVAVEFPPERIKLSTQDIYDALLKLGVIVRPVAPYEMPNHLRISIGLEHENEACLKALKQVLSV